MEVPRARDARRAVTTLLAAALAVLAAAGLGGCTPGTLPTASPGDLTAVLDALRAREVVVEEAVSGDAGCAVAGLTDNALRIRFDTPEATGQQAYLYRFRPRDYEASDPEVDACEAELRDTASPAPVTRLDVAPFRVLGVGWRSDAERRVREALEAVVRGN